MKKIIYFLFLFSLISTFSMAQNLDLSSSFDKEIMPTDEEIRKTIQMLNVDEQYANEVFQETKKRLNMIYSAKTKEELERIILPEIERVNRNLDFETPVLKTNPKKLN